jgi:signal transduction histidine kinase
MAKEMQGISMRLRLTLWIAIIFTLVLWVTFVIFWLYQRESVNKVFIDILMQRTSGISVQLDARVPEVTRKELDDLAQEAVQAIEFEVIHIDVFTASGVPIDAEEHAGTSSEQLPLQEALNTINPVYLHNPELLSSIIDIPEAETLDSAMLMQLAGSDGLPYVLCVATSDRFVQRQLAVVNDVMMMSFMSAPLLGLLSGWFVSGIAVAPLRKVQQLIRDLGPRQLDRSLELSSGGAEVSELVQELDQARKRIRDAFEAQERFLANVSHEIKTPISVLLVESQTLNLEGLPDEIVYFVDSTQGEMSRLGNLVESFLTLTRIEDGAGKARGKRYAANDLAMDSVEHCAVMANQLGVWLRPRLFSDEDTIDLSVSGEPELLTTMLDNLIRNAIRFSSKDDGVEIVLTDEGDQIGFAVRDSGPGIDEAKLATIFDRFTQASQHERKGRGHGLGLTIAKGIAELHRGTISVRNRERGCEFKVLLPKYQPAPARATSDN